ncbi:hypothetical protein BHE74_00056137 [Ensete ventricosum]|uniref:Uncharacterized protein n=1 Tax=Ensete ventricosum TaxID=4639 RepID=A0A444DH95_ENSVE|nr:hypothetical protein GW17_00039707 [Ensete ventricosum]RWW38622.1 hypothetical protein BHE74_00056137 [Ensete ventricosum]RZR73071.1 hypothetical protein BHM03_00019753 [Ensete ventricosum]
MVVAVGAGAAMLAGMFMWLRKRRQRQGRSNTRIVIIERDPFSQIMINSFVVVLLLPTEVVSSYRIMAVTRAGATTVAGLSSLLRKRTTVVGEEQH